MGGKASVRGIENIINNLQNMHPSVVQHLREAAEQAGKHLQGEALNMASLTCHSLDELAALGHPYSTAYPTDSFVHKDELVHIQSGDLFANIERVVSVDDERVIVAVGVHEARVPYIKYLIDGTWKMRPRDFLGHAFQKTRKDCVRILKFGIVAGLGSRGRRL